MDRRPNGRLSESRGTLGTQATSIRPLVFLGSSRSMPREARVHPRLVSADLCSAAFSAIVCPVPSRAPGVLTRIKMPSMSVRLIASAGIIVALVSASTFGAEGSPLVDAAARGDHTAVRTLIEQGRDVNAARVDGMTALHAAVARRSPGHRRTRCCRPARRRRPAIATASRRSISPASTATPT